MREKINAIKFSPNPHGFVVMTPSDDGCFSVEDRICNYSFQGCVDYLKAREDNVFVVYDFCYSRIGGGNSRGLILINWHPKGDSAMRPGLVAEKLRIFVKIEATSAADLERHRVIDAAARGNCAYGMDF